MEREDGEGSFNKPKISVISSNGKKIVSFYQVECTAAQDANFNSKTAKTKLSSFWQYWSKKVSNRDEPNHLCFLQSTSVYIP